MPVCSHAFTRRFPPCSTQHRRHSKRVVQQIAYKTVSNMAERWTLALTCIIMNTTARPRTHAHAHLVGWWMEEPLMIGQNQHKTFSLTGQDSLFFFPSSSSVVTSHDRLLSSYSHQPGPPTRHYPKLSAQIFTISGGRQQARNLARICKCVCVWGTMNGCGGEQLYMLRVFSEGKCTLSPSRGEHR